MKGLKYIFDRKCGLYVTGLCFQEDLVHTIGESVALGASGIVLWGDGNYSKTKVGMINTEITHFC